MGKSSRSIGRRGLLTGACTVAASSCWADEVLEALLRNTNTNSKPSELKITDLRVATFTNAPMICPLVRIDTNQGIYGLGEVRDGASATYALMLKSRILGENPAMPWWDSLVEGVDKPIVNHGYITMPDMPGLGVTLNDEVVKQHLFVPGYFEPTPLWNTERSADRLFS